MDFFPKGYRRVVGYGLFSIVYGGRVDGEVTKFPRNTGCSAAIRTERHIYERLSSPEQHPGVLPYLGCVDEADGIVGIRLAVAEHGQLSRYLLEHGAEIGLADRLRWAAQVAEALRYVHSRDVVHCDLSCNNVLLDERLDAVLADFSGSSIDGSTAEAVASLSHTPAVACSPRKMDIFAFGSTLYQVMTGRAPLEGEADAVVEERFARRDFPSLEAVECPERLRDVIYGCWNGKYEDVDQVIAGLSSEVGHCK